MQHALFCRHITETSLSLQINHHPLTSVPTLSSLDASILISTRTVDV